MVKHDEELDRARLLDRVLKIINESYPEGRATSPVYLRHHLQSQLNVENFLLIKYLKAEHNVFQITKEISDGREIDADVSLTPESLQKIRQGDPWFEKDLLSRRELGRMFEHDSRQKRERIARDSAEKKMQDDKEKEERIQIDRDRLEREQRAEQREIEREKREVALVKEVVDSRASEARLRKWNLWLAIATVISSCVAAYGALKDKLFDTKEIMLLDQITTLNAKIETTKEDYNKLLQQYNALPDSIKSKYNSTK